MNIQVSDTSVDKNMDTFQNKLDEYVIKEKMFQQPQCALVGK